MSEEHIEHVIEEVFEAPAKALEETVEFVEKEEAALFSKKPFKMAEEYWETIGPGLTTGAADDDPSGIATYSQTGAQFGPRLLWLSLFSFPFMVTVQEMCARIGLVTGHGLAANIRRHFPLWMLYSMTALLLIANTFNIGADFGAMAQGVQLLAPRMSFALLVIGFGVLTAALQIYTTYARYAKVLKYLSFVLLAYIASALLAGLNWRDALHHLVIPSMSFDKGTLLLICGILGTTISPYLFFWQTAQEVEERNLRGLEDETKWQQDIHPETIKAMRKDTWTGMFFSQAVMFFIIAACSGTLFAHGLTNINTAADAATALRPFAGDYAYFLFAIGIIGVGLLAVPVLAGSSSYAISEAFNFKQGLYRKLNDAYAFYGVIILSVVIGIVLNFVHLDPIKALIYSAVANGVVAPVAIFFIVKLAADKRVMGEYTNKKFTTVLGWVTVAFMGAAGIAAIWTLF